MNSIRTNFLLILAILMFVSSCHAQTDSEQKIDRLPAVAGKFYPASKEELTNMLKGFFSQAGEPSVCEPLAVIVPHAGYVYSGMVSASAFRQISRDKQFKRIFIIGSSHTMNFYGASVYTQGDFITPLGRVPVDALAKELVEKNKILNNNVQPHVSEHSIEVQLPFLQYWLKKPFTIVPVIIGGESETTSQKLADILKPYFNSENLFVISTDFSHYPSYSDAVISDHAMAKAIVTNSVSEFMHSKNSCESSNTPNEVTAMCGWTSVLTLLNITGGRSDVKYSEVIYKNSGDSEYGEKNRVVGYFGICVCPVSNDAEEINFKLDDSDKIELLKIARNTITQYLKKGNYYSAEQGSLSANILTPAGAFVTLKENGELRGCIGNFSAEKPLFKTIQDMAIAAATQDPRFTPVTLGDVPQLEIEISVLTPMKRIGSIDAIELGKHGIYIKKGSRGGTFLPQVATETGWSKEEFLGHCARDKAGIGWDGWKEAEIYIYEALVFSESNFK
jgi:MEMO1 family protein